MTNLATYTQIAQLVNSWAAQIEMIDLGYLPADLGGDALAQLIVDMRAFGNGLRDTVETFKPIVAAINEVVAQGNRPKFVEVEVRRMHDGTPVQRHVFNDIAFGWMFTIDLPDKTSYIVEARYPHKYPMTPEEV